jgi:hypothetical protein
MHLMKRRTILWTLVLGLLVAPLAVLAETAQTLHGEYAWDQGGASGDLEAVFTPKADGEWDVAFHFTFRGRPHTYEGTAEGSLTEGSLKGTVQNDNKRRTFTFQGTCAAGKFSGTHAEVTNGKEYRTGTLKLDL